MNPNDAIVGLLGTIFFMIAATLGVFMVVSPARLVNLGVWVGRLMGFRKTDPRWGGSRKREWRIGGTLVTVTAISMAIFALQVFLGANRSTSVAPIQEARPNRTEGFYPLGGALVMFSLGTFIVVRSKPLLNAMQARSGFSVGSGTSSHWMGVLVLRLVGAVFILAGLVSIWRWLST